jgi:hypothetical protein
VNGKKILSPRVGKSAALEQKSFGCGAYPKSPWQHAACESISPSSMTPENISLFSEISAEQPLKDL